MAMCFVIQPFDKGRFDKRYEDIFVPAIRGADLEPYRVDRDPGVSIPIEDIQSGIESSEVCLVDITSDNPNVWFELGYAIASKREIVLVCSDERQSRFPFDIQHRSVIKYSTESSRDFETLKQQITAKLKALLKKKQQLGEISKIPSVAKFEGLEQYEIAALVAIAQQIDAPHGFTSVYSVRQDMEKSGFTKLATTLGLKALLDKSMISDSEEQDDSGYTFTAYRITDEGMKWLFENQDKLTLKQEPRQAPPMNDDIPF